MMKNTKVCTLLMTAAVLFASGVYAETINSISQVEETALLNNLDYRRAVLEVKKAEDGLEDILKINNSSLSLSSTYGSENNFQWRTAADLPLFEQISISASLDQDMKGTVGFNFNLLSHSVKVKTSRLDYEQKRAAAKETAETIAKASIKSYLDWSAAKTDLDILGRTAALKEDAYNDEKIRYEKGESVLDDVRSAFTAWSESRAAVITAKNSLLDLEKTLYLNLGIDPQNSTILSVEMDSLYTCISGLETELKSAEYSVTGRYAVINAQIEAEKSETVYKNTWLFDPQLLIGGALSISPNTMYPETSITASVSFGYDSWNKEKQEERKAALEINRREKTQIRNSEQLSLQQAMVSAENSDINCSIAETEMEQAKELLEEARFQYTQGEYSSLELEETVIQYSQSQNNLFKALAARYMALRTLKTYAVQK